MAKYYWKKYEVNKTSKYEIKKRKINYKVLLEEVRARSICKFDENTGIFKLIVNTSANGTAYVAVGDKVHKGWISEEPNPKGGALKVKMFEGEEEWSAVEKNLYSQGSYIGEIIADENAYRNNQRNSDGYWYVRDRLANIFYSQNNPVNKFYSQSKNLKIHQEDKEW